MIIRCEQCNTSFELDEELIKPGGRKVRCYTCKNVFRVHPPFPENNTQEPDVVDLSILDDEVAHIEPLEPEVREFLGSGPEETIFLSPEEMDFSSEPEIHEKSDEEKCVPIKMDVGRGVLKEKEEEKDIKPGETVSQKALKGVSGFVTKILPFKRKKKRIISFRRRLLYFALMQIGLIAIIVIPIESYRPIEKLHLLIRNGNSLIAGVQAAMDTKELARINEFALNTIERDFIHFDKNNYYFLSFNMLITEGKILPEKEILDKLESFELFGGKKNFSYEKLKETGYYWKQRFLLDKGIFEILKKYKGILINAVEKASEAGFEISGFMIMLDTGKKKDFFENHIATVLDSYDWWESAYCGEAYDMSEENEFWRADALKGQPGFNHNPIYDPNNYYLPRFDEDEYGTWFSVWRTIEINGNYNLLSIDLDAGIVKRSLRIVLGTVGAVIFVLLGFIIIIANHFSKAVTRPITELTIGAKEVAGGNYDYEVPVISNDEIGEFTKQFNAMTKGQKERLNLMETMERFLSKELAEKAAKSGLVFGGQKADCTVMFTDFAGFSTITRKMTARESVNVLNAYYDTLIPIIKKYGGFPDKYIGDAIVAIFGAPVPFEDHAQKAVACAIEMQWKMRELNLKRRSKGKVIFEMRIGLNSGEVIVGAIGCEKKLEYTSIGETTNLANRMESKCAIGHIMIAEGTYEKIKNIFFKGVHISLTPEQVQVKGYPKPVSAYKIYVNNLEIEKDINSPDPLRKFYSYRNVDHHLKNHPSEVKGIRFISEAKYL